MPPPVYSDVEKLRIRERFSGRVMCIITKEKRFAYNWKSRGSDDTVKFAVPYDMTLQNFRIEIHKMLKTLNDKPVTDAIFVSVKDRILNGSNYIIGDISTEYGTKGFVYMTIHGENTFG
jgi:hypothetical protein